jgi:hypothetical protein
MLGCGSAFRTEHVHSMKRGLADLAECGVDYRADVLFPDVGPHGVQAGTDSGYRIYSTGDGIAFGA